MTRRCKLLQLLVLCSLSTTLCGQSVEATQMQDTTAIADPPECLFCEAGTACFVDTAGHCPPFSVSLTQSDNTSECVCHPGFFMQDNTCVLCPSGFYCPGFHADAENSYTNDSTTRRRLLQSGSDILPCPANSSSVTGADSVTMCLCNIGYAAVNCSILETPVVLNNPPENKRSYSTTCGGHTAGNLGAQSMLDSASYWVGDWRCGEAAVGTYMTIDLGKRYQIHGVVTQNSRFDPHLVTSIKVKYSDTTVYSSFVFVDGGTIFQLPNELNWEQTVSTYSYFSQPVTARYIRLEPQTWISLMLMKAGVLTSELPGFAPSLNSSTCKPLCVACEPGTYKGVVSNVVACEACAANTYSSSTSACAACPESTEAPPASTDVSSCLPSCEPGYTGPAGSQCAQCGVGKYKNSSGNSPCMPCPPGHGSWNGASICTMCVPGKYALDAGNDCDACPKGKYSTAFAGVGAESCQKCANGSYSSGSASAESLQNSFGFDVCLQCPPNSNSRPGIFGSGNVLDSQCSCNAGYALYPGWPWHPTEDIRLPAEQLCQPCAAGTYQPEAVQWGEISYYESEYWAPTCLPCPAHMTSAPGSAMCVCSAGSYGVSNGALCESCEVNEFSAPGAVTAADCRCSAGFFREEEGLLCVPCPVNSFRVFGETELTCVSCSPGSTTSYNASNSSAMCVVCPAGSFVAEGGDCRPCPEHGSSLSGTVGSCQCEAGYTLGTDSCVECAAGYYKDFAGNEECVACELGKLGADVPERTHKNISCASCPVNTYWAVISATSDAVVSTACLNCTANSVSTAGSLNATSCQCIAGYYAVGGSCQACAPGTFKDSVSSDTACSFCGGRTYTPFSAATQCLSCLGNSTGDVLSNDAQTDCRCDPGFTGSDGGPCVACESGKFKLAAGSHGCVDCGPSAFWPIQAEATENHCQSCPAHSARAPDAWGLGVLDCQCQAGYLRVNESTCSICPEHFHCPTQHMQIPCFMHTFSVAGSSDSDHCRCVAVEAGYADNCTACPADTFCPADVASPLPCPANSSTEGQIARGVVADCLCDWEFYRGEGTDADSCHACDPLRGEILCGREELLPCPPNSRALRGAANVFECACDPGFRNSEVVDHDAQNSTAVCIACHADEVCRRGVATQCSWGATNVNSHCVCSAGSYCSASAVTCTEESAYECSGCPHNHWCYNNTRRSCAANEQAPENSTSVHLCRCIDGFYRHALGACTVCPLHHVCTNETLRPVAQYDANLRTLSTGTANLHDAVCVAGMFRTARTDLCKLCPVNFFCPQSDVPLPNVVRCPENQFTFESGAIFPSDCICLAGFRLMGTSEEPRCLPCGIGERCQGGQVVEEMCHLQNKIASADHESCVCQKGFGFVNFECTACPSGYVKPLEGDTPCLSCQIDTYAVNDTTCLQCPEHSDARPASSRCKCAAPYVWTANATCELCATDHYWEHSSCRACPVLSSNQPTADMLLGPAACHCAPGHHRVPKNVSGELACTACAAGSYEQAGECRACGSGAWAPALSTAASACVCNALPNVSSTCHTLRVDGTCVGECASPPAACTQCLPGHYKPVYSTPGNSENCALCHEGFFQAAYAAVSCDLCPQHEWHEYRGQTSVFACLCDPGFARSLALNGTETVVKPPCQACTRGHYKNWLGDQQCLECEVGRYQPNVAETFCHFCSDATLALYLTGNISDESHFFHMLDPVLQSNTTVRAAAVSVNECVCDVGQEPSRISGNFSFCRPCLVGSFKEQKNHEHCTYCGGVSFDHGHSLLHHYGVAGTGVADYSHCAACPSLSGQNETLVGPDKLIMNSISGCLCFPGHERRHSELGSECRNCSQYKIQTAISNDLCTFCPAGHFFVERNTACQLCDLPEDGGDRHVGFVLNVNDHSLPWGTSQDDCTCRLGYERSFDSQCKACPAGKFHASNLSRACTACPHDTFQDSVAQLSCLSCPPNASTVSLHGSSTMQNCVCGPGFQPLSVLDSYTGVCQPCAAGSFRRSRMQNESREACISCPEDHYCPLGAITPVPCAGVEVSDVNSSTQTDCKCPPGFERELHPRNFDANQSYENSSRRVELQRGNCTLCAKGFFSAVSSNRPCLQCPTNKTTTSLGARNQTTCTCVSGHGVDVMLPSAPCSPCLSGSFSIGGRNEPCKSCGWGTQTNPFYLPETINSCMCNANLGVHIK